MDTLELIGSAMGLGLLSGLRLYFTVLALGLGIRFDLFHFTGQFSGLHVLADNKVMIGAGIGFVMEFLADKIPWVDSIWDAVHTFVRPIAAVVLGAAAFAQVDPGLRILLSLIAGGMAVSSSASKAATRLVVNHSPEPFSNIALSIMGDIAAPIGIWLTTTHPLVMMAIAIPFFLVFLWLVPRVFRLLRLEVAALYGLLDRVFGVEKEGLVPVPENLARAVFDEFPAPEPLLGIRCAATKSTGGLSRSIGFLCPLEAHYVFVTKRNFRTRMHVINRSDVRRVFTESGLLLPDLVIETARGQHRFDLFLNTAAADFVGQPAVA
jgi:hypothetical protein